MTQTHIPATSAIKGVLLVSAAVFLFAAGDTAGKILFAFYSIPLILALRYSLNVLILLAVLGPRHGVALFRYRRPWLVLARGAMLALSSFVFAMALQRMPVGETVAITYLAPFVVLLLAGPLLGEVVGRWGWIAAVGGFLGVLLIVRPGSGLNPTGVGFAMLAASGAVGYHLLTRFLARTETTVALLVSTALVGCLSYAAVLALTWPGMASVPTPGLGQVGLLIGLTVASTLGHFLFTAGYREAPAALLAPMNYLHIVWATLLGWAVFAHMPDALTIAGMGCVLASGALVALRSARKPVDQIASSAQIGT